MKRPSVRTRRAELARCAMFLCLTVAVTGAACGPIDAADAGRELFANPRLSISPSNAFACATCHATTQGGTEQTIFSGYTMLGASERETLWGGRYTLLIDAVNFCLSEFMRGEKLDMTNQDGLSLLAYLQSLDASDGADASARPLTVVQNINDVYLAMLPPGDPGRGERLYDAACASCHGDVHTGKGRLGSYVSAIPDDTIKGFGAQARAITIEKIRHGKFFGIGGNMPFYSLEALSDAELSDIVTFLVP